jgi:hypothetical protein
MRRKTHHLKDHRPKRSNQLKGRSSFNSNYMFQNFYIIITKTFKQIRAKKHRSLQKQIMVNEIRCIIEA